MFHIKEEEIEAHRDDLVPTAQPTMISESGFQLQGGGGVSREGMILGLLYPSGVRVIGAQGGTEAVNGDQKEMVCLQDVCKASRRWQVPSQLPLTEPDKVTGQAMTRPGPPQLGLACAWENLNISK